MRDPKRIDRICDLLEDFWKQVPDWRLGQLISNVIGRRDPFFIEDEDMEKSLECYLKAVLEERNEN